MNDELRHQGIVEASDFRWVRYKGNRKMWEMEGRSREVGVEWAPLKYKFTEAKNPTLSIVQKLKKALGTWVDTTRSVYRLVYVVFFRPKQQAIQAHTGQSTEACGFRSTQLQKHSSDGKTDTLFA